MNIRTATIEDLPIITEVENTCFLPSEAASYNSFKDRLTYYPNHFYLLFSDNTFISFVDGMCTNTKDLLDEMYGNASLHEEDGAWQMIFGVNTLPQYRKQGYAGILLNTIIEDAKKANRKGLVLTCKEYLIHYYAKFGFVNEGVSGSEHGNVVWHQMRLTF